MSNARVYRTIQWFKQDAQYRLINSTYYHDLHHISKDNLIYETLSNEQDRLFVESALREYKVEFTPLVTSTWNGHITDRENIIKVSSSIESWSGYKWILPNEFTTGIFVRRIKPSKELRYPEKIYRVLAVSRASNLLFLSDFKDANNKYLANLFEYHHHFGNIDLDENGIPINVDRTNHYEELFVTDIEDGYVFY